MRLQGHQKHTFSQQFENKIQRITTPMQSKSLNWNGHEFSAFGPGAIPLKKSFLDTITGLIYVVDSCDREQTEHASRVLMTTVASDLVPDVPILILANKQELSSARTPRQMLSDLQLDLLRNRQWFLLPVDVYSGYGMKEIQEWIRLSMGSRYPFQKRFPSFSMKSYQRSEPIAQISYAVNEGQEEVDVEVVLYDWIAREDDMDADYLSQFQANELNIWDHYNFIRIGWILIKDYGIKDGFSTIETALRSFIERSGRTDGRTFHATMTRFWCHMIAYAIEHVQWCDPSVDRNDFKAFLRALDEQRKLFDPPIVPLWDKKLFQRYYSNPVIFSADARTVIERPDVASLPDLLDLLQEKRSTDGLDATNNAGDKKDADSAAAQTACPVDKNSTTGSTVLYHDAIFLNSTFYWQAVL
mmetsp:Transcript_7241/g.12035  ORF Transcript_7241/g.12035 Transcript_7241/m.12035 type:complete len:414 (+) Transcript_7241:144-1385(+)